MRLATFLLLVMSGAAGTGCSICSSPLDGVYEAEGGRWVREDPCCGRVGSAFAEAGYQAGPYEGEGWQDGAWDEMAPLDWEGEAPAE